MAMRAVVREKENGLQEEGDFDDEKQYNEILSSETYYNIDAKEEGIKKPPRKSKASKVSSPPREHDDDDQYSTPHTQANLYSNIQKKQVFMDAPQDPDYDSAPSVPSKYLIGENYMAVSVMDGRVVPDVVPSKKTHNYEIVEPFPETPGDRHSGDGDDFITCDEEYSGYSTVDIKKDKDIRPGDRSAVPPDTARTSWGTGQDADIDEMIMQENDIY